MENELIRVIVPVYNVSRYIDRCMTSLLKQTYENIEIILVDDGSPDDCGFKCDQYARTDSRVYVIHKKNAGLGMARNSGLDIAKGKYVAFIDSDDYVDEQMFERLYDRLKHEKADTCFCRYYDRTSDGQNFLAREESVLRRGSLGTSAWYDWKPSGRGGRCRNWDVCLERALC